MSKKNIIMEIISLSICAVVFVYALLQVIRISAQYRTGIEEYKALSEHVKVSGKKVMGVIGSGVAGEREGGPVWTEDQSVPDITVDHEALKAENSDYLGWLYMESVGISYPVVQGTDNEFYLHKTFDKTQNVNGCIFLDYANWPDLTDYNSFIFGHNMKNGTMFGSLKKMLNDRSYIDNDPYFYFIAKDWIKKYHIYSLYVTPPDSDSFNYSDTKEAYKKYIAMALAQSVYDCNEPITEDELTVTLSTCSGTGKAKKRLLVHGKLVGIIPLTEAGAVSYNRVPDKVEEAGETGPGEAGAVEPHPEKQNDMARQSDNEIEEKPAQAVGTEKDVGIEEGAGGREEQAEDKADNGLTENQDVDRGEAAAESTGAMETEAPAKKPLISGVAPME